MLGVAGQAAFGSSAILLGWERFIGRMIGVSNGNRREQTGLRENWYYVRQ